MQKPRDIWVQAKLKPIADSNNSTPRRPDKTCKRSHCTYCSKLDRTRHINLVATKRRYTTRTEILVQMLEHHIYAIVCRIFGKTYIGQTQHQFMNRMMEHFRNVRQNCQTDIVSRHYTRPDHDRISDMILYILEFIPPHHNSAIEAKRRNKAEINWIFPMRTPVPSGLNIHD